MEDLKELEELEDLEEMEDSASEGMLLRAILELAKKCQTIEELRASLREILGK